MLASVTLVSNPTELTYCQSKESVKRPRPSLFVAPPKSRVSVVAVVPVACIAARH